MVTLSAGLIPFIPFDRASDVPFYQQIYDGFRTAIVSERLRPRERLPSTRALARDLEISRLPVLVAFEQLMHEGYLVGKVGSGTYVSDHIPDEIAIPISWGESVVRASQPEPPPAAEAVNVRVGRSRGVFRIGMPALDRFPHQTFARLVRRHAAASCIDCLGLGDPAGYLPLRAAVAEYVRAARAVDCDASQVLIVSGSQMALHVAALALNAPGGTVCIEEPGYPLARAALTAIGADVTPINVDAEGIDVSAIVELGARAKAAFVTPSHQFPLGMSMSASRRRDLLDWADSNDAWILEDDYDSEFRYSSRSLASLQGMDAAGRVIYIGTFSNVLFPALRLGYIVVPHALVERFVKVREVVDLFPPVLNQLVLTDFLREGHFARHLRRMKTLYRARRDALVDALQLFAADVLTVGNVEAGLQLVAYLADDVDDREVVRLAARHQLMPWSLSECYAGEGARRGLLLGFGGSDEASLAAGVRELAALIRTMQ
jgi:GntR family transcriptional regulator/MocR family aminotransferase